MDIERLKIILELKEKYIKAYIDVYANSFENMKDLQMGIDSYAYNIAKSFLYEYGKFLEKDENLKRELMEHLCEIGANEKHSGHRVCEALYKQLTQATTDDTELEK